MRYRKATLATLALAGTGLMAGCGSSNDSSGSPSGSTSGPAKATGKAAKVALIVPAYSDYQQAQVKGLKEAVTPGGGSVKVFNSNFDGQKLQSQCQDAIQSHRYNVIVLNPPEGAVGVPCATAAKAAGIPVLDDIIPIGKDPNSADQAVPGVVGGVYGTADNNSRVVGETLKLACQGLNPCKVIAEQGTATDPFSNQALRDAAKQQPNVKIVQKYVSFYDPNTVAKSLPDLLAAHRDASVYLALADSTALAAVPIIKQAGMLGKIKIVGGGGTFLGAKAIKDGTLFASSGNWPIKEGKTLGDMAVKAVNGQAINPKAVVNTKLGVPEVLTKDTVDQFVPEWGAQ